MKLPLRFELDCSRRPRPGLAVAAPRAPIQPRASVGCHPESARTPWCIADQGQPPRSLRAERLPDQDQFMAGIQGRNRQPRKCLTLSCSAMPKRPDQWAEICTTAMASSWPPGTDTILTTALRPAPKNSLTSLALALLPKPKINKRVSGSIFRPRVRESHPAQRDPGTRGTTWCLGLGCHMVTRPVE